MTNAAKLAIRLILPELARPPAIPTRLLSAIPMLKKRSGYFLPNHSVRVELLTSPSTTIRSGWSAPSASRARPNASRVALPSSRFDFNAEDAPAIGFATLIQGRKELGLGLRVPIQPDASTR